MPARSEPYDTPAIVTFAKELEAWRKAGGLNKKQLADALGYTDSYVGQIELCKNSPSVDFADALDTFFKTNGVFHRLWGRIEDSKHAVTLPPGFPEYLDLEIRAAYIRNFSPNLVPGLLQTENYARTVIGASRPPDFVDRLVHERLRRQDIFANETPPRTWFTMDEAVLRRRVGNSEVMREQLSRILEFGENSTNQINIVPLSVGFHEGLGGMFTILGFEDGSSVAYTESGGEGMLIHQPSRIAGRLVHYDSVRGHALGVKDSRTLIMTVMEEL